MHIKRSQTLPISIERSLQSAGSSSMRMIAMGTRKKVETHELRFSRSATLVDLGKHNDEKQPDLPTFDSYSCHDNCSGASSWYKGDSDKPNLMDHKPRSHHLDDQDAYQFEWFRLLIAMASFQTSITIIMSFMLSFNSVDIQFLLAFVGCIGTSIMAMLMWTSSCLFGEVFGLSSRSGLPGAHLPSRPSSRVFRRCLWYLWYTVLFGSSSFMLFAVMFRWF